MKDLLEQHAITSRSGEYSRDVWLIRGPEDKPHSLGVVLDAEIYLESLQCAPTIETLTAAGDVPAMTWVFVSRESWEARHRDYVCSLPFSRFVAEDVVRWAREDNERVARGGNLICGLSLSALAAAHIAFHFPGVFSKALCQSGSFWWLVGKNVRFPGASTRVWMSVGDQETESDVAHPPTGLFQGVSQIEGVEYAVRMFREGSANVRYNRYSGGHGPIWWHDELRTALKWLVGSTTKAASDADCDALV